LLVIIGKSSSGKSTVEEILREEHHYNKIISYTTRPMRSGEKNGVDYHYITKEEFKKLDKLKFFAESTDNYNNYYGISKKDCDENSVVVVEKHGLKQLRDSGIKIKAFYLYQSPIVRFKRMWKRGDDLKGIIQRILTDDIKFIGARKACDVALKVVDGYEVASAISMSDNLLNFASDVFKSAMTRDIIEEGDK